MGADVEVGRVVGEPIVDEGVGHPVESDQEEVPATLGVGSAPLHHGVDAGEGDPVSSPASTSTSIPAKKSYSCYPPDSYGLLPVPGLRCETSLFFRIIHGGVD